MRRKKTGLAALVFGAALALVPATAMARDRDEHYPGGRGDEWHERHERIERREHERGRGGLSFGFYNGAPAPRYYAPAPPPSNGYYDQYGNWRPSGPNGYYDQYGYWHQY